MKIALVTHFFDSHGGGIEIVAGQLARQFARLGASVEWLAADVSPAPASAPGVTPVPLGALNITERWLGVPFPVPSPSAAVRIWRAVGSADAVVVHDALYLSSIIAALAARWHRRPLMIVQHIGVVAYRNPLLRWAFRIADRLVSRPMIGRADQVVFIGENTAKHFSKVDFRRSPEVIFNGVDSAVFRPAPTVDMPARERLGLPLAKPVALFVGRFVEKKGLRVIQRLARARPEVAFALAGWGSEDPSQWHLPNVHVLKGLSGPALAELYHASDLLLLPSSGEGFPLVVQEALSCGLAVLCGEDPAVADPAAAPFLNVAAVSPEKCKETAARFLPLLDAVLAKVPDETGRVARARFASSRYSWPAAARRHLALLDNLVPHAATACVPARSTVL